MVTTTPETVPGRGEPEACSALLTDARDGAMERTGVEPATPRGGRVVAPSGGSDRPAGGGRDG